MFQMEEQKIEPLLSVATCSGSHGWYRGRVETLDADSVATWREPWFQR